MIRSSLIRSSLLALAVAASASCTGTARGTPSQWDTATPAEAGMDSGGIRIAMHEVSQGRFGNIHSVVIVRGDKLVSEDYFTGRDQRRGFQLGEVQFDANTPHDIRSITKSVTSLLLGIALAEHPEVTVDTPIIDVLTEYAERASAGGRALRIRDALTMSLGLDWNEWTIPYENPANSERRMDAAQDPVEYVLGLASIGTPGETFNYSGGASTLLAAVVQKLSGRNVSAYAREKLMGPLGITDFTWLADPVGRPYAASGLRLMPRDLARIGALVLAKGRWNGKQVVPAQWIEESVKPRLPVTDGPRALMQYGYQWWLGAGEINGVHREWIVGMGYGGQRLFIVPSLNLVIAVTAGMYGDPRQDEFTFALMRNRLAAGVRLEQVVP
jgi:CubicO group peptidase (beta-lactamase class C family)